MLTIITIAKDNVQDIIKSINSTNGLRNFNNVQQLIIDGSNLENSQKIKEFLLCEHNIQYFYQNPQGVAKAFNYGIELSKDGWLWFLNSGDEVHPNLDIMLFFKILQESRSDVIIFDIEYNTGIITKHPSLPNLWPPVFNWIPHPGTLIKRNTLLSVNGFRENFSIAMDGDLWFRLLKNDITTDLVSIPVAKFYEGGLSSDVSKTSKEVTQILFNYFLLNIKIWLHEGKRIISSLLYYLKCSKF